MKLVTGKQKYRFLNNKIFKYKSYDEINIKFEFSVKTPIYMPCFEPLMSTNIGKRLKNMYGYRTGTCVK